MLTRPYGRTARAFFSFVYDGCRVVASIEKASREQSLATAEMKWGVTYLYADRSAIRSQGRCYAGVIPNRASVNARGFEDIAITATDTNKAPNHISPAISVLRSSLARFSICRRLPEGVGSTDCWNGVGLNP